MFLVSNKEDFIEESNRAEREKGSRRRGLQITVHEGAISSRSESSQIAAND
jgi:hypothetical protein